MLLCVASIRALRADCLSATHGQIPYSTRPRLCPSELLHGSRELRIERDLNTRCRSYLRSVPCSWYTERMRPSGLESGGVDRSEGVQIVQFALVPARIGRVWKGGCSQSVLTDL